MLERERERETRFENWLDRKLNLTLENSISQKKDVENVRVQLGSWLPSEHARARARPFFNSFVESTPLPSFGIFEKREGDEVKGWRERRREARGCE